MGDRVDVERRFMPPKPGQTDQGALTRDNSLRKQLVFTGLNRPH